VFVVEKYFNPNGTYDKAIREREVGVLRALLTGIIGSDPTFVTTEFDEALEYIKNKSIDFYGEELLLTQGYLKQEDEYEIEEREEWDEHYFQMNLVWLRDNFCLSKRRPLIEEIGKKVYENKNTYGKSKAESRRRAANERSINIPARAVSKKERTARTADGSDDERSRLFVFFQNTIKACWNKMKDYWRVALIVFIIILGVELFGKN